MAANSDGLLPRLPLHRICGIGDQIDKDLPQSDLARFDIVGSFGRRPVHRNARLGKTRLSQIHSRGDHVAQLDPPHWLAFIARKGPEILDDPRRSCAESRNALEVVLGHIALALRQKRTPFSANCPIAMRG